MPEMGQIRVTLAAPNRWEQTIDKSIFIAQAVPIESPDEAMDQLTQLRYPEATHNVWAYRIGQAYRFNDDGEPGGTGGQPVLRAIDGQGLDGVLVVVTRFFGGIKLGTGGLVRAYGGTAAECLRLAPRLEIRPTVSFVLSVPFDCTGPIYPLLDRWPLVRNGEEYTAAGVQITVTMEEGAETGFAEAVRDASRGRVVVRMVSP